MGPCATNERVFPRIYCQPQYQPKNLYFQQTLTLQGIPSSRTTMKVLAILLQIESWVPQFNSIQFKFLNDIKLRVGSYIYWNSFTSN